MNNQLRVQNRMELRAPEDQMIGGEYNLWYLAPKNVNLLE